MNTTLFYLIYRSVVLLMQVSMPCMLFAAGPTHVTLKGGTNAEMAPQIDYTTLVRLDIPAFKRRHVNVTTNANI